MVNLTILIASLFLFFSCAQVVREKKVKREIASVGTEDPLFKTFLPNLKSFKNLAKSGGKDIYFLKFSINLIDSPHQIYFQDSNEYGFHLPFLSENIPQFKNLNEEEFKRLVFSGENSKLLVGTLYYTKGPKNKKIPGPAMGFSLSFHEEPHLNQVEKAFKILKKKLGFYFSTLYFIFEDRKSFDKFRKPMDVLLGVSTLHMEDLVGKIKTPITYHAAKSYGYLKTISEDEFKKGNYTSKDILIFKKVPLDIGPLAGVISYSPQVPNSHVILRTVNQNIPNIYLPNPLEAKEISTHLNQLIELETSEGGQYFIRGKAQVPGIQKKAKQYFKSRRKDLPPISLNLINQIIFKSDRKSELNKEMVSSYGAKGVNFALINKSLEGREDLKTILVPFSFYHEHLKNPLSNELCQRAKKSCLKGINKTCEEAHQLCLGLVNSKKNINDYIRALLSRNNYQNLMALGSYRKSQLKYLQALIKMTPLNQTFKNKLFPILEESFRQDQRIRFRSSTNAEDLPNINGAGLYDSKAGCLKDSPCLSEREKDFIFEKIKLIRESSPFPEKGDLIKSLEKKMIRPKSIAKAIKGVFSSLWNEKAFLYRDFYGIPHEKVKMGLLIHPSFQAEKANGVLLAYPKKGLLQTSISVQKGDISITNPKIPGIRGDFLKTEFSKEEGLGQVNYIDHSSLTINSAPILSPFQLNALHQKTDQLIKAFSSFYGKRYALSFDLEFKVNPKNRVVIKQIRPLESPPYKNISIKLPQKGTMGSFDFVPKQHGWNHFTFDIGGLNFKFFTPEGENQRNMTPNGWRPKISYNALRVTKDGANVISHSRWFDEGEFKEWERVYCKLTYKIPQFKNTSGKISLKELAKTFNIKQSSFLCSLNLPLKEKGFICLGENRSGEGEIKTFGAFIPFYNKKIGGTRPGMMVGLQGKTKFVPRESINFCVNKNIYQLKMQGLPDPKGPNHYFNEYKYFNSKYRFW